jgi:hypothetical protein
MAEVDDEGKDCLRGSGLGMAQKPAMKTERPQMRG